VQLSPGPEEHRASAHQNREAAQQMHIRTYIISTTMVLPDMNCTPPEFICMVHGGKDVVPGGEGEKMQVHSVASTPKFH
jgi:hypothetical protein